MASIALVRALLDSSYSGSTLLYVLFPFTLSIVIYLVFDWRRETQGSGYARHVRLATAVFFSTSIVLMEGFICVLMFMPIYFLLITLGYICVHLMTRDRENKIGAFAIPLMVLLLVSEGLTDTTSIERNETATYETVVAYEIETLKQNMAKPILFAQDRPWFLRLFPLPDRVKAGSIGEGDLHNLHFTYNKWVWGNAHTGQMNVVISEVSERRVRTKVISDTSYLSNYMKIIGTEVNFEPLGPGVTKLSLTVKYERLLDPYWYFGPLQKLAASQSARFLVESIIARQPTRSISDEQRSAQRDSGVQGELADQS